MAFAESPPHGSRPGHRRRQDHPRRRDQRDRAAADRGTHHEAGVGVGVDCDEDPEEIRAALDLAPDIPLVLCDTRDKESVKTVLLALLALLEHVMRAPAAEASGDRQPVQPCGQEGFVADTAVAVSVPSHSANWPSSRATWWAPESGRPITIVG